MDEFAKVSEITPYLYLTGGTGAEIDSVKVTPNPVLPKCSHCSPLNSLSIFKANGIGLVINMATELPALDYGPDVRLVKFEARDTPGQNLKQYFPVSFVVSYYFETN